MSSFFWIETTIAIFNFCGKTPCPIDKLDIWLIGIENNLLNSFKTHLRCWRGPQIFLCQDCLYSLLLLLELLDIHRRFGNFFVNFTCNGCQRIIKILAYFNGLWGDFSFIYVQKFYFIMICFRFEIFETFSKFGLDFLFFF